MPAERKASVASVDGWKALLADTIGDRRLLVVLDDVWGEEDGTGIHAPRAERRLRRHHLLQGRRRHAWRTLSWCPNWIRPPACGSSAKSPPRAVAADPDAAANLVGAVCGLPLALVLIGRPAARIRRGRPRPHRRAFQTVSPATASRSTPAKRTVPAPLAEIIEVAFPALRSDAARQAMLALSIFRPKPGTPSEIALHVAAGTQPGILYDLSGHRPHRALRRRQIHHARVIAEYARTRLPCPNPRRSTTRPSITTPDNCRATSTPIR